MSSTQTMTRGGAERSFMSQMSSSSSGMQSSLLGFVAKQEMPVHLSILFRARYSSIDLNIVLGLLLNSLNLWRKASVNPMFPTSTVSETICPYSKRVSHQSPRDKRRRMRRRKESRRKRSLNISCSRKRNRRNVSNCLHSCLESKEARVQRKLSHSHSSVLGPPLERLVSMRMTSNLHHQTLQATEILGNRLKLLDACITHSLSTLSSSYQLSLKLNARCYLYWYFIGNPYNDPNIKGDPFRSLFVSNLAF